MTHKKFFFQGFFDRLLKMMIENQNIMSTEIANSMITNTLLTSMKTGSLIDAITSLVFISDFKNKYTKNITIITVLLFGVLIHKATKELDFLTLFYKVIVKKVNELFISQLNREYKVSGIAHNKEEEAYFKEQYNIIALLCQVNKLNKNIDYEILSDGKFIGQCNSNSSVYVRIMNIKSLNDDFYVQTTLINPPLNETWYKLDNDIEFIWYTIDRETKDKMGFDCYKFKYILRSKTMNSEELSRYIDDLRTGLLNDLNKLEQNVNRNNKNFQGSSYTLDSSYALRQKSPFVRNMDSLFFKEKDKLIRLLNAFDNKIGVYNKLQHRHKIGILIYGKPGNGKTSLSVAIATYLKRDILSVSLSDTTLTDDKLSYIFSNYGSSKVIILDELDTHKALRPRVAENSSDTFSLLDSQEDSKEDCKKDSKESSKKSSPKEKETFTLGGFLESLDGVSNNKGRVVIAITNHPDHLDPAILRPGRFDIIINMVSLDNASIRGYLEYLLDSLPTDKQEIEDTCEYCKNFEISTSIIEQAVIEKFSNPEKNLSLCLKEIYESFVYLNSQHRK